MSVLDILQGCYNVAKVVKHLLEQYRENNESAKQLIDRIDAVYPALKTVEESCDKIPKNKVHMFVQALTNMINLFDDSTRSAYYAFKPDVSLTVSI
jgi:uncharacterized protein Yka (UPF0111/DUF47 family)